MLKIKRFKLTVMVNNNTNHNNTNHGHDDTKGKENSLKKSLKISKE